MKFIIFIIISFATLLAAKCNEDPKPSSTDNVYLDAKQAPDTTTAAMAFPYAWPDNILYGKEVNLGEPIDEGSDTLKVTFNEEYIRLIFEHGYINDYPGVWLTPHTFQPTDKAYLFKVDGDLLEWYYTETGITETMAWRKLNPTR